jgi:hypothetical protein
VLLTWGVQVRAALFGIVRGGSYGAPSMPQPSRMRRYPPARWLAEKRLPVCRLNILKPTFVFVIALIGFTPPAVAQETETSVGLFCETVPQIERFLAIQGMSNEAALAIVNDEFGEGHRVCGIGRVEFVEISVEKKVDSWDGDWEIVKIDLRAIYFGAGPVYTEDLIRYTAFLVSRKTPI